MISWISSVDFSTLVKLNRAQLWTRRIGSAQQKNNTKQNSNEKVDTDAASSCSMKSAAIPSDLIHIALSNWIHDHVSPHALSLRSRRRYRCSAKTLSIMEPARLRDCMACHTCLYCLSDEPQFHRCGPCRSYANGPLYGGWRR